VGEFVGTVLAQLSATESGPWGEIPEVSMAVEKAGEAAGGIIGNTVGFYTDNAAVILQNLQTLTDQLYDYRTWTTPQPF
jgi:hypothetical protein